MVPLIFAEDKLFIVLEKCRWKAFIFKRTRTTLDAISKLLCVFFVSSYLWQSIWLLVSVPLPPQGQEYAALGALVNDDEPLSSPPGSTEMELKVKQVSPDYCVFVYSSCWCWPRETFADRKCFKLVNLCHPRTLVDFPCENPCVSTWSATKSRRRTRNVA